MVSLQYVPMCVGDIVSVKNSFFHTYISGADEFTTSKRSEIEFLSRIEGGFRVKDQAMLGPFGTPSSIPIGLRADTGVCPHEDVVTLTI